MAGRPGFFGGSRGSDAPERDAGIGFASNTLLDGPPLIRLGDPNGGRSEGGFAPGFDPVWGTLGAPASTSNDDWLTRPQEGVEGVAVDVEIFGNGFQISGEIRTGQFDRLSDWLNMQTGFIRVHNALHVHLGQTRAPDPDAPHGTLWVRLDQVVLVAERTPVQGNRSGAPIVQKQKRKVSIVTPGYNLRCSIHIHAFGSMEQFLESPDPHFLPISDLTVRWLSDATLATHFPFAMVNRSQLVTVLDEPAAPTGDSRRARGDETESDDDAPLERRWGAA